MLLDPNTWANGDVGTLEIILTSIHTEKRVRLRSDYVKTLTFSCIFWLLMYILHTYFGDFLPSEIPFNVLAPGQPNHPYIHI